jgi:type I restriction enzyme S subunit
MSFPRYPKYKDSGVEWLGEVPEHWESVRFRRVLRERQERSTDGSELLLSVSAYTGVTPRSEIIDEGEHLSRADSLEGYKICRRDDLVMNIMLAWNCGLGFTGYDGIVSPSYCVFRLIDESVPRFLHYLVRSNEYTLYFKAFSAGVVDSRLRLYPETFGQLSCLLPPPIEQSAIATFLDRETAKIDGLIAEQQRLIELLQEKRQAVISHAVTKGLNPDALMKDSGIEWLGEVPEHWEVWKVSRAFSLIGSGTTPRSDNPEYYEDGVIPWVNTGDLTDGQLLDCPKRVTAKALADHTSLRLYPPGSLLFAMYGATIGKLALLGFEATVNQACCVLGDGTAVEPPFMFYWFLGMRSNILSLATGGGQPNVSQDIVRSLRVACPDTAEQLRIVAFLNAKTETLELLQTECWTAITLLQERRAALISAAVTGQIDVRGFSTGGSEAA